MKRKRSDAVESALPVDIGLKIVSSLEAVDVCSLASCSRFWREVCGYDCVWEPLCRGRWATDSLDKEFLARQRELDQPKHAHLKGWREFYVKKHKEMEAEVENKLADYLEQVSSFGLVEGRHYLKALDDLHLMPLTFKDVQLLFFKPKLHVLLNLVALHYCIRFMEVPGKYVMEAMIRCKMVNKKICIRWRKANKCRGFYHFVNSSLGDLLSLYWGDLAFLGRRNFYSSLLVEISAA